MSERSISGLIRRPSAVVGEGRLDRPRRAIRLRRQGARSCLVLLTAVTAALVIMPGRSAHAQSVPTAPPPAIDNPLGIPDLSQIAPPATQPQGVSASLKILVLLTVLSLAPSILIMMTSFTRIVIVLALLRQAIGTQQLPPGQVLVGLALILTMLVMAPTWQQIRADALDPYLDNRISQSAALERAASPLRNFMFRQIETADNTESVYLFAEYSRGPLPDGAEIARDDVRMTELIPAFILSELKTAFVMGFKIYLPFLVIDMVISAILISMGMMMLPPVLVSLPFKLMLFVLADGWSLIVGSLLGSFA